MDDYEWTPEEWEELQFIEGPEPEVKHQPGCPGFEEPLGVSEPCGGVFLCSRCGKYFGWCCGAADGTEADDWCDDCWYEVYGKAS
jgi:hypothetical protein